MNQIKGFTGFLFYNYQFVEENRENEREKMKNKVKNAVLLGTMLTGLAFTLPVSAESIALSELNDFSIENISPSSGAKSIDKSHWAYKTLENISKNYGLLIGEPGKSFDTQVPISRSEAALMVVSMAGQIDKKNVKLTEAEKAKVEILQQEFRAEIDRMESDIALLKGRVTALESRDRKLLGYNYGEDFKITGGMQAAFYGNITKGDRGVPSNFSLPYAEVGVSGKIRDHIEYVAKIIPTRNFNTSPNTILEDAYIKTDIIPHHNLYVGQTWVPFGIESSTNTLNIDFIEYSQIANAIGQNLDTGIMAQGDWGFIDYKAGAYNGSGKNINDQDNALTLAGQFTLKPLYKHPEYGNLQLGGSILGGRAGYNYTNSLTSHKVNGYGAHASYGIGKLTLKGEFLSFYGVTDFANRCEGWYGDIKYQLTDKMQLLGRVDILDPRTKITSDGASAYTLGSNYLLSDNLLLMLNYSYVASKTGKDSNRLGLLTQVMF